MSSTRMWNALRSIVILKRLDIERFTTSRKIRNLFPDLSQDTLYSKINALASFGFIEILKKGGEFGGDDRREYKLTVEGKELRDKLIQYNIEVLSPEIEKILKAKIRKIEKPLIQDKEEKIIDFIMEFSEECKGMVNNETLKGQQAVLRKLLENSL